MLPFWGQVGLASILGALEFDLESLGTDLIAVHCLDGRVGHLVCCEGNNTKASFHDQN